MRLATMILTIPRSYFSPWAILARQHEEACSASVESLPGAVNMATFPNGIFTKYIEEISLKIMETNYTLLTQAYSLMRFPVLALINTICVLASSLQHTKLYSEELERSYGAEFLQKGILMNVVRNTRLFLSLMRYFVCSPSASFLVSEIEYIWEGRPSCLQFWLHCVLFLVRLLWFPNYYFLCKEDQWMK